MSIAAPESQSHSWCEFSFSCDACGASFTHTYTHTCLCWCLPSAAPVWSPSHVIILSALTGDSTMFSLWTFRAFTLTGGLKMWLKGDDDTQQRGWLYPKVLERHCFYQVRFQDMIGGEHVFMYVYWYWTTKKAKITSKHCRYFLWHITAPAIAFGGLHILKPGRSEASLTYQPKGYLNRLLF